MNKDFIVIQYDELPSTQTEAKNLLNLGKIYANTVVATSLQTKGRAKNICSWFSERGDLACTIVLNPHKEPVLHSQITYIAAIAVSNVIIKLCPQALIHHKWVNDVLIATRKVCGILLEQYTNNFVLVGIGINILPKKQLPHLNAIGLIDINHAVNVNTLLPLLLEEFFQLFFHWEQFGFQKIRNLWLAKAMNLNQKIIIKIEEEEKSGIFLGIDEIGNLQLLCDQKVELICAGDVFLYNDNLC